MKGSDIQLVCEISQFSNSDIVNVYKTDSRLPSSLAGITSLTLCVPTFCTTTVSGRYTFSSYYNNVYINITSVNRSDDQKWWTCAIENQRKDMMMTVRSVLITRLYNISFLDKN